MIPHEKVGYYKPSSALSPPAALLLGVAGGVAAVVLACVYAYASAWIPFIYAKLFLTLGLGMGLGFATAWLLRAAHVRHPMVWLGASVALSAVAVYVSWILWVLAITDHEVLAILPWDLASLLPPLAEHGVWEIKGWTPTGSILYGVWIFEALLVAVACVTAVRGAMGDEAYCEPCSAWMPSPQVVQRFQSLADTQAFREKVERSYWSALEALRPTPAAQDFLRVHLWHCPGCGTNDLMRITAVVLRKDSKGNERETTHAVVPTMHVPPEAVRAVRSHVG